MNNLFDFFALKRAVGDDFDKIQDCLNIVSNPIKAIEGFKDTRQGITKVMIAANQFFNLMHKHRNIYLKYGGMNSNEIDELLKGMHNLELALEADLEE